MVEQWKALLFFRNVAPSEIDRMDYFDLRYWCGLADIAIEAQKKAAANFNKGKK